MPVVKYTVSLSKDDRKKLTKIVTKGKATAKVIMHANILLAADTSNGKAKSEYEIGILYHVSSQTVHTIRKGYFTEGLDVAVSRKKRKTPPITPKIIGEVEARIIALSCSTPPEGYSKWTLRLLADKIVELEILDRISHESVFRLLKKTNASHTCTNAG